MRREGQEQQQARKAVKLGGVKYVWAMLVERHNFVRCRITRLSSTASWRKKKADTETGPRRETRAWPTPIPKTGREKAYKKGAKRSERHKRRRRGGRERSAGRTRSRGSGTSGGLRRRSHGHARGRRGPHLAAAVQHVLEGKDDQPMLEAIWDRNRARWQPLVGASLVLDDIFSSSKVRGCEDKEAF